ncbi:MAG TPA: hypothetical protein VJJ72_00490 [Candidatus Paceibacterota bacterium]
MQNDVNSEIAESIQTAEYMAKSELRLERMRANPLAVKAIIRQEEILLEARRKKVALDPIAIAVLDQARRRVRDQAARESGLNNLTRIQNVIDAVAHLDMLLSGQPISEEIGNPFAGFNSQEMEKIWERFESACKKKNVPAALDALRMILVRIKTELIFADPPPLTLPPGYIVFGQEFLPRITGDQKRD